MYARVTQLEIDAVRIGVDDAVEVFRSEVMPKLVEQPGYRGVVVLTTPEGKGVLVSFWDQEAQAATNAGGFYAQTLEEYVTMFASPPGRERYEVALTDLPVPTGS